MRDLGCWTERRVVVVVAIEGETGFPCDLERGFREHGIHVEAVTGADGDIARLFDPEVLLICVPLDAPGWSGFDFLSLIRSHEQSRSEASAPAVAVGRCGCPETRACALATGFLSGVAGEDVPSRWFGEALSRARTLRPYLHRFTPSEDREAIVAGLPAELRVGDRDALLGVALAVGSYGIDLLQRSLTAIYQGDNQGAIGPVARLRALARESGATRLAILCDSIVSASLDGGVDAIERSVFLSRIELDRVVYTLREEALQPFPGE